MRLFYIINLIIVQKNVVNRKLDYGGWIFCSVFNLFSFSARNKRMKEEKKIEREILECNNQNSVNQLIIYNFQFISNNLSCTKGALYHESQIRDNVSQCLVNFRDFIF